MTNNITFTIIKPDAVKNKFTGKIIDKILADGFEIVAMKYLHMQKKQAEKFYEIHKERPFYGELVDFMSSAPVVVAVLKKNDAVSSFRKLIGATNPADAEEGTIRKMYASSLGENAIHGSDSDANALVESSFFFSGIEAVC